MSTSQPETPSEEETMKPTVRTAASDNLGGAISGAIDIAGNVSGSGTVTAGAGGNGSGSFTLPNAEMGPTATVGGGVNGNVSGALTGSLGASAAFAGAFELTYSKSWLDEQVEETQYEVTVSPGDALTFGSSHAQSAPPAEKDDEASSEEEMMKSEDGENLLTTDTSEEDSPPLIGLSVSLLPIDQEEFPYGNAEDFPTAFGKSVD